MAIRKYKISFNKFIKNFVAPEKRQDVREALYNTIMLPFKTMMAEYEVWAEKETIAANVVFETATMEWYLNSLFDPEEQRITFETVEYVGKPLGIRDDNDIIVPFGLRDTNDIIIPILALGIHPIYGKKRFAVLIPAAISSSTEDIKGVVNQYRYAGFTFTIVES